MAAIALAIFFYLLALRADVYRATSPQSVSNAVFGSRAWQIEHPVWLSLHVLLRKAYSVVAFTIVGFAAQRALNPTPRKVLRAMVFIGAYSFIIEVGQRLFVAHEPELESAFDVACGALGGWLAVLIDERLPHGRADVEPAQSASARLR